MITLWLLIMGILLLRKVGERPKEAWAPIETTTLPRVKHNLAQAKRRTR